MTNGAGHMPHTGPLGTLEPIIGVRAESQDPQTITQMCLSIRTSMLAYRLLYSYARKLAAEPRFRLSHKCVMLALIPSMTAIERQARDDVLDRALDPDHGRLSGAARKIVVALRCFDEAPDEAPAIIFRGHDERQAETTALIAETKRRPRLAHFGEAEGSDPADGQQQSQIHDRIADLDRTLARLEIADCETGRAEGMRRKHVADLVALLCVSPTRDVDESVIKVERLNRLRATAVGGDPRRYLMLFVTIEHEQGRWP